MSILGSGIDILNINRLKKSASEHTGLLKRILTKKEIDYCMGKKNAFEHAAGRVALKEAAYKALKTKGITLLWREMEIESAGSAPVFSACCRAAQKLSKEKIEYSLSISHEREYAVASAVFWRKK